MTEKEKQWFVALTADRAESANMLDKPSMRGVQRSVVDKYSDQAHFIYELLQNADDVRATSAHFRLNVNGLFFTHNGSVRFTVSNPQNEEADTNSGSLGHINAITSIANSNKTESSIGKFGVGFKAVFQYTQTPHIYDPNIRFKIERFIVPHTLDADLDGRQSSETVFFFPFDHKSKQPQESHDEILEKLKSLEFPVLFLSNLKSVSFEAEDVTGKYIKEVTRIIKQGDITVQWLTLALEINGESTAQSLLVFTRRNEDGHSSSIGYALDETGNIIPIDRTAFCFFPTKEATNLEFILHAPFLLTDSREGIKAGEKHNQELIQQLAQLAADSLPILRDMKLINDGIFEIIPCYEASFSGLDDRRKISFKPFYTAIKEKLQTDILLPAANGQCSSKSCSYWASDTELVGLFSDEQLAQLTGIENAHWILRSRGWKEVQNANKPLANYIDGGDARAWNRKEPNLIVSSFDPEAVLKIITASFISAQSQEWLHKFYAYLSERASYQKFVKDKPIFLNQDGNAASAFDDNDQLILFLPDEDIDGYTTIKEELLSNKNTHEFVVSFGIKKPSIRDEIYNKILPEYKNDDEIDTTPHFKTFFRYFKECKHEEFDEFIKLISDKAFLEYTTASDETVYRGRASDIYLPFSDLKAWFETKPDTKFLLLDEYREVVDENDFERLDEFLRLLGISSKPRIVDSANDKKIDGLDELLSKIGSEYSEVIWKMLSESWTRYEGFLKVLKQHFGPRGGYKGSFWCESSASRDLRTKAWILNKSGVLCSAEKLTVPMLSEKYDSTSALAESFIKFLGIRDESLDIPHLSEEEARKTRLLDEIEQSGLSDDEIRAAIEDAKRKKGTRRSTDNGEPNPSEGDGGIIDKTDVDASPVLDRINDRIRSPRPPSPMLSADIERERTTDSDYFSPAPVDYSKKIARAEERNANEIAKLEREEALQKKANQLPRYSYGWFLALLELECMASSENNADSKTIFISFGKVERDSQSTRTIVLREPSRFVPQSIEEFSGVRVDLDFGGGRMGKLRIESFTAKEFSLLGKLEAAAELNGIDLDEVLEARIEVQNPSFLLQELLERFRELKFAESFDMKANLTSDIEFIFGPPGTGKTTHLAEKLLIPLMQTAEQAKVLVLTPTNKAADVLTTRIMDKMGVDTSYLHWLVRFGTSADERIEKAGVRRDRSFDIDALERSVTVTTIARFAYDGFAVKYGSKKLFEMEWDAILIDEASMISIASIIYPLYRQNPRKFIIAGDPFQIEPIVAVEQWKDENIYTLVGLNKAGSFAKPVTQPHEYPVTNLEIQYRSIPAIGEIFSRFTYNGILKHHREAGLQRSLKLHGLNVQPLNLIKFPVSKYESIYRAKRLKSGTPYQTYSALFTFEFVRWLTAQMQIGHEERCRIGIIAPYRAQASLLSRLNDSWSAKPESVEIQVGTIHGFQGDECDIIVAVFNPPPNISSSSRMFLNKQNILNVAISRARDYLFIVMPDGETEDISKLDKIARLEELVKSGGDHIEYMSHEIEKVIWDQANYLEENTFSTGHQMVNVYRKPERYYEVRSDESAIDVQIHEND